MLCGALAMIGLAQESWDRPIEIVTRVEGSVYLDPIYNVEVTLRPFVGPLEVRARRLAVFNPPLASDSSDGVGWVRLALPDWAAIIDCPLAVICHDSSDLVLPFDRETYRPHLAVGGGARVARFVDANGDPIAGARVAALVGVHQASHIPQMSWGPRYENLVTAQVATTDVDGSASMPSSAVVALVERGGDAIPVVLDGKSILVPDSFDTAAVDPRLATALKDKGREPPDAGAIKRAMRGKWEGGGSVEGSVFHGGYDDAEVIAVPYGSPLDIMASHRMTTERPRAPFALTDRDGHFRISHLPPGRYRLQVAAPHAAPMLTQAFTIRDGQRVVIKRDIKLERGGIVVVKGTMGYATFGTDLARASRRFDGPNGVIDGLGPGKITVGSWNGGCCGGLSQEVRVPATGEVIVDLSDEAR